VDLKKEEAKGKIVLTHAMEEYGGGNRDKLHLFINSALDSGDRVMDDRKKTVIESTAQSGTHNNAPFPAGDHVACVGEKCTQNFIGKYEGNLPLGIWK